MRPSAQYSPLKLIAIEAIFVFVGLLITAYSATNPVLARLGDQTLSLLIRPFYISANTLKNGIEELWQSYIELIHIREEYEILKDRLARLSQRNSELEEYMYENERLKRLINLKDRFKLRGIGARVVGRDPSPWISALILDRGFQDGVRENNAVMAGEGVVGKVVEVSASLSKMVLINDHTSAVDAFIQRSRARGIVEGRGNMTLVMNFVESRADIEEGDRVVTSGLDGIFPKGLIIGTVTKVIKPKRKLFQFVEVTPAVDLNDVEEVLILTDTESRGIN